MPAIIKFRDKALQDIIVVQKYLSDGTSSNKLFLKNNNKGKDNENIR